MGATTTVRQGPKAKKSPSPMTSRGPAIGASGDQTALSCRRNGSNAPQTPRDSSRRYSTIDCGDVEDAGPVGSPLHSKRAPRRHCTSCARACRHPAPRRDPSRSPHNCAGRRARSYARAEGLARELRDGRCMPTQRVPRAGEYEAGVGRRCWLEGRSQSTTSVECCRGSAWRPVND